MKADWEYIKRLEDLFVSSGSEVYYVELKAEYDTRIKRNMTENRLKEKPTKRDFKFSETMFKDIEEKYRLNSYEGEIKKKHYMKINNTDLEPSVIANMIKDRFGF
ncbi:MAG: hypothetical protein RG740_00465 [Acholeplasmataceae bacterium]|nr:hypothetical protein [Acholeplasmataceae bacterium]